MTVVEVLTQVRAHLKMVESALADVKGANPGKRMPGWSNVTVWGRSVTSALQRLRSAAAPGAFDKWYEPWRTEMANDPLMRWVYQERSNILKAAKQSKLTVSGTFTVDTNKLPLNNPPPGARNFILGDLFGGSGWEIELPDGTTEMHYVELPEGIMVDCKSHLPEAPKQHLGAVLPDNSMETVATAYVVYLRRLCASASEVFGQTNQHV